MRTILYEKLNNAWKQTTKILLGKEIGELEKYEDILIRGIGKAIMKKKSKLSDNRITVPTIYKNLPVAKYDEVSTLRKIKLNIDEIKDIDTIVERLKEEFLYTGEMVLGKSSEVINSHQVIDSQYVINSYNVFSSKFVMYSKYVRDSKYIFGSLITAGKTSFVVLSKSVGGNASSRVFESLVIGESSDIYYSVNCLGCQETFFTFCKNGARYTIGNLQLNPDKYKKIKDGLLEEIRDNLKTKKHVSLFDLFVENTKEREETKNFIRKKLEYKDYLIPFSKQPIEEAWTQTTKLILKKPLEGGIDSYSNWLKKGSFYYEWLPIKSTFMNYDIFVSCIKLYDLNEKIVKSAYSSYNECNILKTISLDFSEISQLSFKHIDELKRILSRIYVLTMAYKDDFSINSDEIIILTKARHNYKTPLALFSKYTAFDVWPRESSYQFGSALILRSEFGINVYNSEDIKRGFEVDNCAHSSDIYFSHNCEGSSDVMFCFNGKGLRNSIGHNILQRDKYLDIKAKLLEQIWQELNSKKTFKYGIYSLVKEE